MLPGDPDSRESLASLPLRERDELLDLLSESRLALLLLLLLPFVPTFLVKDLFKESLQLLLDKLLLLLLLLFNDSLLESLVFVNDFPLLESRLESLGCLVNDFNDSLLLFLP